MTQMQVFAHRANLSPRGGRLLGENTLEAVREAVARKPIDGVEVDLRCAADGLIVFHGTDALGLVPGALRPPSWMRIDQINTALHARKKQPVLTWRTFIDEIGDAMKACNKQVIIDAKFVSALPREIMDALVVARSKMNCLIGVRSERVVRQLVEVFEPEQLLGLPLHDALIPRLARPGVGNMRIWPRSATPQYVASLKQCGLRVFVTMGNELHPGRASAAEVERVRKTGVDAILVNRPLDVITPLID